MMQFILNEISLGAKFSLMKSLVDFKLVVFFNLCRINHFFCDHIFPLEPRESIRVMSAHVKMEVLNPSNRGCYFKAEILNVEYSISYFNH